MDLKKRCFFIVSGISNELGKVLAVEFCKKFKPGSVVVLVEDSQSDLARTKAAICLLQNKISVVCCNIDWTMGRTNVFKNQLEDILGNYNKDDFELAFIVHNEGAIATDILSEPKNSDLWLHYVQISLNVTIGLNQAFLKIFEGNDRLVVNLTPSARVVPFQFEKLQCSARKARDMYFRAMAAGEDNVTVLNYRPGYLEAFEDITLFDPNNNINDLEPIKSKMEVEQQLVKPLETINKLINTLECLKFSSGHDIDYNA